MRVIVTTSPGARAFSGRIPNGIVVEPFAVDDNVMLVGGIHPRGCTTAEAVPRAGTLHSLTAFGGVSPA